MNRQEILEALKNDNYYRNLSDKDFFDANNLDNLAKYLEHNFAKTDESKKVILDMLSHKKHNPNDFYNYRITQEELFNLNKKYYDNTYLYHGLNAYTTNLTDKSLDISEKIENNLYNIINNKDMELATSSTHMIGDIGIKGKGDSLFAQPWDMYSVVDKKTGKRNKPRARTIITEDDIFEIIEKYHKNPKSIKPWKKHDEVIAKNFEIDSLWVKEDFYNNNQDFVLKLLKDNKIQNLDIIHSNSFEQYRDVNIERLNVNNINLKNNKAITNKNIRQELLELVSQTRSHAVNETDSKIASFLNGEISLSQEELETIKNEFTDKWFNTAPFERKLKEYEHYSFKEYSNLPDDEYDDDIAEKLLDKVSNRKDLTKTFDITKDKQLYFDKQWKKDDVFKFSNGTSETRARLFLSEGKGYTSLQTPAFVEGETYLSRTGLQISMQGTDFESRSPGYAKAQSSRFKDRPVIIEGEIPAQYVYANQTRGGEFGIPHQYYDKISSAKILDAETRRELYHLENGKLVKSDSFIEAKLPELKIKKENNIKNLVNQPSIIDHKKPIHETKSISDASTITKDKKIIYNNLQSLNDIERKAIDIYENGTRKEFRDFFEENFEDEYDSFKAFKTDLLTKAKGYTKIENKVFSDALDEAFKQSSVYDVETYRKSKEIADKYFAHLGRTKESQDMILDYIANDINIDSDKLLKANAKYFEKQSVNHGLYAFPDDIYTVKGPTNNPLERIDDNINDIMKNKQMEMSLTSSEYMIGPIGVTGKTSPIAYHTNDMRSHLEFSFDGGKRVYQQNNKRGTGTVQDIIDSLERESTVDLFSKHDELIGKGLDIESLWVKEDFYTKNKDYVHELMQKYNINNLDLIHASENTEKIIPSQIERINVSSKENVEDKKLTPKEAFDKYGPNDDRFYTSQGLDPKEQKEAINKLNSKRKPPEPLPDYSADDARLDKMFAEDKANIESLKKTKKKPKYKPVKEPKVEETVKQDKNLEKATNEVQDNFTENINNIPKPKVENTTKPSKNIVKPAKNTSKMTTKSLGKAGKGAIGLIVAGITGLAIGKALSSDNDNKDKKQDKQVAKQQNISYNNQYIDNQYAMQMAQDISSYGYGKHMTGFVNF